MAIKINASRKTTIILLVVLFLIVGGTGSYLLWRVNQENTVAPSDSEAGAGCCCTQACKDGFPGYNWCICGCSSSDPCNSDTGDKCQEPCAPLPGVECRAGYECNNKVHCCWPRVAFCDTSTNKCECKLPPNHCYDTEPQCSPECPDGYVKCSGSECVGDVVNVECQHDCLSCNNRYYVCERCVKKAPANTCGNGKLDTGEECDPEITTTQCGGQACNSDCTCPEVPTDTTCDPSQAGWIKDPSAGGRKYERCKESVEFSYKVADPQGVDLNSIRVTVDGVAVPFTKNPTTGTPTTAIVSGTLNTPSACLTAGARTIKIIWKDVNGNPKTAESPCKTERTFTITPVNTCDAVGAKWVKAPPTSTTYGKAIDYEYITGDTDGVQNINIIVKLDGDVITNFTKNPKTGDPPTITVKGSLANNLSIGNHKLEISWNDIKGAGGVPCYVSASIKVNPQNPQWDIEKTSTEQCLDDGTEDPSSKVTNTITIENTNTTPGSVGIINKVVDTLDSKVDGSTVTDISNGGVYVDGKITWTLSAPLSEFAPGESKNFTYSYVVSKDAFGIYDNTVVATTSTNENLEAGSKIEVKCNVFIPDIPEPPVEVPETGIFDESENIVILGTILLFLGLGWTWLNRTYEIVNGRLVQRNKERFERRVVKN